MGVDVGGIAQAFVAARRAGTALPLYPGEAPGDLAAAYAIQDAAIALWDRPVGGWKVGRINPPRDALLGADRLAGPVLADTIFEEQTQPPMAIFAGGFAAAEAEFMLRLAPPPGDDLPANNSAAMDWIDEIRIGLEIASSPYPGINRDGPCVTISDHGNNAGLVLGAAVPRERWGDLDTVEVSLEIDGKVAGTATTATMLDGPFGAARFLLGNLASRGIEPQAGCWISSGAITGVHEIGPGAKLKASFAGIGSVSAAIAG